MLTKEEWKKPYATKNWIKTGPIFKSHIKKRKNSLYQISLRMWQSHKIMFNSLFPTSQNLWEFSLQVCPITEWTKHWILICPTKFWFKILHLTFSYCSLPAAPPPFKYQTHNLAQSLRLWRLSVCILHEHC